MEEGDFRDEHKMHRDHNPNLNHKLNPILTLLAITDMYIVYVPFV